MTNLSLGIYPIYTGSGASYIKPSLQYVFSGEGNIAFGYGLYGCSIKSGAEWYMKRFGIGTVKVAYMLGDWSHILGKIDLLDLVNKLKFIRYKDKIDKKLLTINFTSKEEYRNYFKNLVDALGKSLSEENSIANKLLFEYYNSLLSCAIITKDEDHYNLYEQRFWCDRVPDLLDWSRTITRMQMNKVRIQLLRENKEVSWSTEYGTFNSISELLDHQGYLYGRNLYKLIADSYDENKYKSASLFLLRSGIDGIRYPIGTLGTGLGKVNGWNYVSFSDDNIEIIHHWENGKLVK